MRKVYAPVRRLHRHFRERLLRVRVSATDVDVGYETTDIVTVALPKDRRPSTSVYFQVAQCSTNHSTTTAGGNTTHVDVALFDFATCVAGAGELHQPDDG